MQATMYRQKSVSTFLLCHNVHGRLFWKKGTNIWVTMYRQKSISIFLKYDNIHERKCQWLHNNTKHNTYAQLSWKLEPLPQQSMIVWIMWIESLGHREPSDKRIIVHQISPTRFVESLHSSGADASINCKKDKEPIRSSTTYRLVI